MSDEQGTVEDLKKLRVELIERRWKEAYLVGSAHHDERLEKLILVHTAIVALDEVISEGKDEPAGIPVEPGYRIS